VAYQTSAYTKEEIANYFACHYSTVTWMVAKCKTWPLFACLITVKLYFSGLLAGIIRVFLTKLQSIFKLLAS